MEALLRPLFLIPILTGPSLMLIGYVFLRYPTKKINYFSGYRTPRSMKSQEHWDFAQRYSSREMITWGGYLTLSALLGLVFVPSESVALLTAVCIMMAAVIIVVIKTERALKDRFGR